MCYYFHSGLLFLILYFILQPLLWYFVSSLDHAVTFVLPFLQNIAISNGN